MTIAQSGLMDVLGAPQQSLTDLPTDPGPGTNALAADDSGDPLYIGTGIKIAYLHVGNTGDPNYYLSMQLGLSDGTLASSTVVDIDTIDVGGGFGSYGAAPEKFFALNGRLLFVATDHTHGRELWVTNGTAAGTTFLKDINAVSATAAHDGFQGYNNPSGDNVYDRFVTYNGEAYFAANDGVHGQALWKTDGTEAGTVLAADIIAGGPASNAFPAYLTAFDNKLYFVTTIGGIGQLWSFDGTTATQVTHFSESAGNLANNPSVFGLLVSNNKLYFDYFTGAFDGTSQQLYTLDTGVALGAHLIAPSHLGQGGAPSNVKDVDGTLYFTQSDGVHGSELWKSNGTDAGTVMIKDINPGDNNSNSNPYDFVKMGSWIYFVALDGTHGFELWKTDGLVGGTTEMVKDINTTASGPFTEGAFFSGAHLTVIGNTLYFAATDGTGVGQHGSELWKTDGTAVGTVMVKDLVADNGSSYPSEFVDVNGTLYFEAQDTVSGTNSIWKSDGTASGTVVVANGTNGGYNAFGVLVLSPPPTAHNDVFATDETAAIGPALSLFSDNGSGADTGTSIAITAVNGDGGSVGNQIMLASGALLTVNADGTFDYDPNHAFDALPAAGSGASNTVGHDSFTYTLAGGSTATVSIAVNGVDSDDTLQGTSGNDNFDGGIGDDTVVFTGAATDYSATYNPVTHAYTFIDNRSGHPGGTDTVKNVEFFKTSDGVTTIGLDFAGRIETLSFIANDGSTKFAQFDRAEVHNWEEIVTDHDIAGNLTMQTATMDNGGTWVNTYDPTDANAMLTDTKHFDPEDRLIQETVTRDDGTHLLSVYDIYNQFAWADATLTYDANWNFVSISGHRDNASTTISLSEVRPFLDTLLWFATPFDPNYDSAPQAMTLTSSDGTDALYGHDGDDVIDGRGGSDVIVGGRGNDFLSGGAGSDRFVFHAGDGQDTITDFTPSVDHIDLHGYDLASFAALQSLMIELDGDTVIRFDPQNTLTLQSVTPDQLGTGDFQLFA